MNLLPLTLSALIACAYGLQLTKPHRTIYEWKVMEFNFPSNHTRKQAQAAGNLNPTNAMLIDVQPHYGKTRFRTFVTIPRFQDGIPFTLATVSRTKHSRSPLLEPYPNYKSHNNHNGTNCDAITSAFRVAITECNQMWVMDSGSVGLNALCPPQLLLFDLKTDQLIYRYRFPKSLYTPGASLFINPVVNVRDPPPHGKCRHTMVYIADVNYHGLVVYDLMQDKAWRVENMFMYPDPNHGLHTVAGESFVLMDGIFGMATDKRSLYFHPLASKMEYSIPLNILDNSTLFENNSGNMFEAFRVLGKRKSQCTVSAMDSKDNLYCVSLNPIELTMWNVKKL